VVKPPINFLYLTGWGVWRATYPNASDLRPGRCILRRLRSLLGVTHPAKFQGSLTGFTRLPTAFSSWIWTTNPNRVSTPSRNVATQTTRPPRRHSTPVFGGVLKWRGLGEKKKEKNAADLRIESASREWQADTLTTQPRRLVDAGYKATQQQQNLVLSRVVNESPHRMFAARKNNGFVTAKKSGTTNKFFVAATENLAAATKRFVDRTNHFVIVTKYFCCPYFNNSFCWYNKTFYTVSGFDERPECALFWFWSYVPT